MVINYISTPLSKENIYVNICINTHTTCNIILEITLFVGNMKPLKGENFSFESGFFLDLQAVFPTHRSSGRYCSVQETH